MVTDRCYTVCYRVRGLCVTAGVLSRSGLSTEGSWPCFCASSEGRLGTESPTPVISGSQLPRLPPGLLARKLGPIRQKSHNSVSVWGFVSGLNRGGITVVLSRSVRVSYSCSSSTTHQKAFVGNVNIKSSVLQNLKPQNKCATLGLIIRQYFLHDIQTGDLGWML